MRNLAIATGLMLALSACASTPDPIISEPNTIDPVCESLRAIRLDLSDLPPDLDLSAYEDVTFRVTEISGEQVVFLSFEDYNRLILLLTESGEHIGVLREILNEQVNLYERALSSEELG